jgi:hypothetical protein
LILNETINNYFLNGYRVPKHRFESVFLYDKYAYLRGWQGHIGLKSYMTVSDLYNDSLYLNMTLYEPIRTLSGNFISYSFKKQNHIFIKLSLTDILNCNAENQVQLNALMVAQIQALKFAKIDCSNPATFFERLQKHFYVTRDGILFFAGRSEEMQGYLIQLTWAELKPYLNSSWKF